MPRPRRRAFSLVELMTVIGIIAVLIALLMPAMVRARAAAQSIVCQSNLRQIHQACITRSIEHHGYAQLAGFMNGLLFVSPATIGDADQKRYAYYTDNGLTRPAPLQAALAPYIGGAHVRLDSAENLLADLSDGVIAKIFTCPSQPTPLPPGTMMGGGTLDGWFAPKPPTSYGYNEGIFGFIDNSDHWLRGNLGHVHSTSETIVFTDALPRTEFGPGFVAWMPKRTGRVTLADAYTNDNGTFGAGVASQFDLFRHHYRMNVVFADGHVESLTINPNDLQRGLLLAE